jgi:hypothetical protein
MNNEQLTMINERSSINSSALGGVNLGNIYLSNQLNLGNLWLKINQSKQLNYAKRTQFPKKSNVYNRSFNNQLQRKFDNGHLVKTNPIKPNFIRRPVRRSFSEGGFKMA